MLVMRLRIGLVVWAVLGGSVIVVVVRAAIEWRQFMIVQVMIAIGCVAEKRIWREPRSILL